MAKHDELYADLEAKETIECINNNLLYHPGRPTYKDHFGFAPGEEGGTGFYVQVPPSQ